MILAMRWLAIPIIWVVAAAGWPRLVCSAPFPGEPVPAYFSGTNCRAFGWVSHDENPPAQQLLAARLYVNGTQVDGAVGGPGTSWVVLLGAMFDSTHFPHGTLVEVRVEAIATDLSVVTDSYYAPVYNWAALVGRYDMDVEPKNEYGFGSENWKGLPTAHSAVIAMNYLSYQHTPLGWTADEFLTCMEPANLVYLHSHGHPLPYTWSDTNDYHLADVWLERIRPYDTGGVTLPGDRFVRPRKLQAVGQGYPPFNSGVSPVNLAFVDACYTGVTNAFAEAFLVPYYNGYNST